MIRNIKALAIAVLVATSLAVTMYYVRHHAQVPAGEPIVALPQALTPEESNTLEREVAAGNPDAQLRLAHRLEFFNGSQIRAFSLMSAAAKQGHPGAELELGRRLIGDIPMWERDPEEIHRWASSSTERGVWQVKPVIEGLWLVERPEEGVYWLELAAKHGQVEAWNDLERIYKGGKGIARNSEQSAYWTHKLAEAGDQFGIVDYAKLLEKGEGVRRDPIQALGWLYLVIAAVPPEVGSGEFARQIAKRIEATLTADEIAAAREKTKEIATKTRVCIGGLQNCRMASPDIVRH